MTREETQDLLALINAAYPNFNPADVSATVNLWHAMLSDYPANIVILAVKKHIATDTSGFAPAVGQVIDAVQSLTAEEELSEMQAWSLVAKAVRNGIYGAEEEFEKLPDVVKAAVGSPAQIRAWSLSTPKEVHSVGMSNFMRSYRAEVARKRVYDKTPKDVRLAIQNATRRLIDDK